MTKEAIIRYTGATAIVDKTIFAPISGVAKYDRTKAAKYTGIYEYKQDVAPCPAPLECCENCPVESADPVCDKQTFIIKAKAHHYYVDGACECSTCNI